MKSRHMAWFFLYLFTFHYVLGVVAAQYYGGGGGGGVAQPPTGCRLTPQCQTKLETCFLRVQEGMPNDFNVPNQRVEEYELTQGTASGFQNFVWEQFTCTCGQNSVRIFVRVNFLRILLTFVMNLLEDLLGGLLGGLGSALARTLGNVVNLLVRILALQIEVEITIVQRFIPGTKCVLESFRVSRVTTIRILGLDLAPVVQLLSPLLTPVVDAVLQAIFNDRVKEAFRREIESMTILRTEVIC